MKQWHILGAGAIGLLWAGKLIDAGHQVTLILRSEERLRQFSELNNLQISDGDTEHAYLPAVELADSSAEITNLLITTKSFNAIEGFNSVVHRITPSTRVLLLHNGMGPQQQLVADYPDLELWAGSTTDGAYLNAPFRLVKAGNGETIIGCLSSAPRTDLADELKASGVKVKYTEQIEPVLWQKLAINCAINPLTAIYNCRNGELLKYDDRRAAMAQICKEVEQVAAAIGIPLFDRKLMEQAWDIAELTGANHSSMQQDMAYGRETEIDTITGYLCRAAKQAGISVPANQMVLDAIRSMAGDR